MQKSTNTTSEAKILPKTGKTLDEVRPLLGPAWIIEGEDPDTYERLLAEVAKAIGPRDFLEWLLIKDIVALTWEIQRARRLSQSLTALSQRQALAAILKQLLPKPTVQSPTRDEHLKLVEQWSNGQEAAVKKIEALFVQADFSMSEVDAQALTEHAEEFDRIDARSARCEDRRDKLLQQIERRRSGSAKSVLDASEGVIEADFVTTPPNGASANGARRRDK